MTVLTLQKLSRPFFATLHKCLFSGELYDPFSEFFVAVDPELANVQYIQPAVTTGALPGDEGFGGQVSYQEDFSLDNEGGGLRLWESKYTFRREMLPAFVGETFGRKVCVFVRVLRTALLRSETDFLNRQELEFHSVQLPR